MFFTICTNGQTDSALSQLVTLLMRCNLPMVNGSTTPVTIATNGTDRDAAFTNRIGSCVLDMTELGREQDPVA